MWLRLPRIPSRIKIEKMSFYLNQFNLGGQISCDDCGARYSTSAGEKECPWCNRCSSGNEVNHGLLDLFRRQKRLDSDIAKVLHEKRHELYETDPTDV